MSECIDYYIFHSIWIQEIIWSISTFMIVYFFPIFIMSLAQKNLVPNFNSILELNTSLCISLRKKKIVCYFDCRLHWFSFEIFCIWRMIEMKCFYRFCSIRWWNWSGATFRSCLWRFEWDEVDASMLLCSPFNCLPSIAFRYFSFQHINFYLRTLNLLVSIDSIFTVHRKNIGKSFDSQQLLASIKLSASAEWRVKCIILSCTTNKCDESAPRLVWFALLYVWPTKMKFIRNNNPDCAAPPSNMDNANNCYNV